jgi:hypothetical protein
MKLWTELLPRVGVMEKAIATSEMPARDGPLCRWCPVKSCAHHRG